MVPDFSDELCQGVQPNSSLLFSVQVPHLEESWTFEEKHWFDPPIFSFALVAATAV